MLDASRPRYGQSICVLLLGALWCAPLLSHVDARESGRVIGCRCVSDTGEEWIEAVLVRTSTSMLGEFITFESGAERLAAVGAGPIPVTARPAWADACMNDRAVTAAKAEIARAQLHLRLDEPAMRESFAQDGYYKQSSLTPWGYAHLAWRWSILFVLVAVVVTASFTFARVFARVRYQKFLTRTSGGQCPLCAYTLGRAAGRRCPECGCDVSAIASEAEAVLRAPATR